MSVNQTKNEPPVFYGITNLARRCNLSLVTVVKRIDELGIQPDGIVVRAGQANPIFAASRLATLRAILNNPEHNIV